MRQRKSVLITTQHPCSLKNLAHNLREMILFFRAMVGLVALLLATGVSGAENLVLSKSDRWLEVSSSKDIDTAIGVATLYANENARVVSVDDGRFAVVMGPFKKARTLAELTRRHTDLPALPADALLSRGKTYHETVWQAGQTETARFLAYAQDKPLKLRSGKLKVAVKVLAPSGDYASGVSVVSGSVEGGGEFSFTFGDPADSSMGMTAGIARLDTGTGQPQIVLTRNSGGAHCCTRTWIVTKPDAATGWILLAAADLDGEGFGFQDVDGDGAMEMTSADNNFLYMFDSYAASFAPSIYLRLAGDELVDVSATTPARHVILQDLAALEFQGQLDSNVWRTNGYLAAWVAAKTRLGEGEDAWLTMLENFDRGTEFAQKECLTEAPVDECPAESLRDIPFPQALKRFLELTGYDPIPQLAYSRGF